MSEIHAMISIINRRQYKRFEDLYNEHGVSLGLTVLGSGTAASDILDYFGLSASEKAVLIHIVTLETWKSIKADLQKKLYIDVPGTGIAFIVPLSSVGGKKQLQFLLNGQTFEKGEEQTLKDTKYELLMIIANQGYTEQIMDAARSEGAGGGTVIHAKGTGMEQAAQFMGFSLASEKEIVLIVVAHEKKNDIMRAVMDRTGLTSDAKAVVFSLPVTATAGMRLKEMNEE
ncbi:MAG: P-II family nitrogen regulator [Oscillospiraceae bacterium]|nr:P-II family nitrogen regulator [Oscillospiraceae bacterium]